MSQALHIAKTGLEAQDKRMSVVSNNLANVNTTGFKKDQVSFNDLMYQSVEQAGAAATQTTQLPSGMNIGTGVRTAGTEKIFSQGNINQTDNSLDLAIDGGGFFQVQQQNGELAYTRDGSFQLNAEGELVTSRGQRLQPNITIPEDAESVTVGQDGTVSVQLPGNAQATEVGTIELASFTNPAGLEPIGGNLLTETGASGAPQTGTPGLDQFGSVMQGALETSNVSTVEEMVKMIETQRAFELNSKAISKTDEMMRFINNQL